MLKIDMFKPEHLLTLTPQPQQREEWVQAVDAKIDGLGWSVLKEGKTLACAILSELGDERAAVLAFIGSDAGPHMRSVFMAARRMFRAYRYQRIEATVLAGFPAGDRLMRMLQFKLETPNGMRRFGPKGETYMLYSRVM